MKFAILLTISLLALGSTHGKETSERIKAKASNTKQEKQHFSGGMRSGGSFGGGMRSGSSGFSSGMRSSSSGFSSGRGNSYLSTRGRSYGYSGSSSRPLSTDHVLNYNNNNSRGKISRPYSSTYYNSKGYYNTGNTYYSRPSYLGYRGPRYSGWGYPGYYGWRSGYWGSPYYYDYPYLDSDYYPEYALGRRSRPGAFKRCGWVCEQEAGSCQSPKPATDKNGFLTCECDGQVELIENWCRTKRGCRKAHDGKCPKVIQKKKEEKAGTE